MKTLPDIVLIGAGNLATRLGPALQNAGYIIRQVFSRTDTSARLLGNRLEVPYTTNPDEIARNAEMYIFSVKDDALPEVLIRMNPVTGLCVHTAGSIPIDIFESYTARSGVFYPLQTFSKDRNVSFSDIPVFIEASHKSDEVILMQMASSLSGNVNLLSSEKRKYLHLAAVFACNFSNHMYTLAAEVLEEQGLDWNVLLPLINETAAKVNIMRPESAQTGPAVRNDTKVMDMHLNLLPDENKKEVYRCMSRSILSSKFKVIRFT